MGYDVFTFDPIKLYNTTQEYKARKERIGKDLEKHMGKVWEGGLGGEAGKAAMFALAPAAYVATSPIRGTWNKRKDVADFFRETGIGAPSEEEKEQGAEDPVGIVGTAGKLLGKLRDIFLESPDHVQLISEQGGIDVEDIENTLQQIAPESMAKMKKSADDYLEFTEDFLNQVWENSGKNLASLRTIKKAATFDEFIASLEKANREGFDIGGPSPQELKKHFDDSIKELMTGEDREKFVNSVLETTGKKSPEELTEEELAKAAKEAIFLSSTEKIRSDLDTVERDLTEKMEEALKDVRPSVADAEALKQTVAGKKFLGLYDKFFAKVMAKK